MNDKVAPDGQLEHVLSSVHRLGFRVRFRDMGETWGEIFGSLKWIFVNKVLSDVNKTTSILHELAHYYCPGSSEALAQSIASSVARVWGIKGEGWWVEELKPLTEAEQRKLQAVVPRMLDELS